MSSPWPPRTLICFPSPVAFHVRSCLSVPAEKPAANLHVNPYPNENAQECEGGNEGYVGEQLFGNPPGLQGKPEAGP